MKRLLPLCLLLAACSTEDDAPAVEARAVAGRCLYDNAFAQTPECKAYVGTRWGPNLAAKDCVELQRGSFEEGLDCVREDLAGVCHLDEGDPLASELFIYGTQPSVCGGAALGCEGFGGGRFEPEPTCDVTPSLTGQVFIQPEQTCREPLPGEPAGASDGQVCTNGLISACTEPGRRFTDYASCSDVFTQRPYFAYPDDVTPDPNDARLNDATYLAELAWAKSEVEACACVCCHSEGLAPDGSSGWNIDRTLWLDTVDDSGLAMFLGKIDSTSFGAYPADQNNGFDRTTLGLPTSDIPRMRALLQAEYDRRGLTDAYAENAPPFGGPLYDQLVFEPEPCGEGQGVDAEGRLVWTGGLARYVYVLDADSDSPTVPPNLDLPDGTRWRIDVPSDGSPISGPIVYGSVPAGTAQRFPADGNPPDLVSQERYYLYVSADVGVPITRCVFER